MWRQLGSWGVGGTTARNGPLVFPPTGAPVTMASNPTLPQYSSSMYGAGAMPVSNQPSWVGRNASWIVPIVTTLLGGWLQSRSQRNANNANLRNAREQREWDLKMWEMMNEYNDPKNQRARMEGAGFSPWGLAEKGNAGNPSSSPTMRAPTFESELKNLDLSGIMNVLDFYQNYRMKEEQIKSVRLGYNLTDEKINSEILNQLHINTSNAWLQKQISGYDERTKAVRLSNDQKSTMIKYYEGYLNQRNINLQKDTQLKLQKLDIMNLTEDKLVYEINNILPANLRGKNTANEIAKAMLDAKQRMNAIGNQVYEVGATEQDSFIQRTIASIVARLMGYKVEQSGTW